MSDVLLVALLSSPVIAGVLGVLAAWIAASRKQCETPPQVIVISPQVYQVQSFYCVTQQK